MKLTLDRICLSTNDLCLKCSKKLKNGEVTKVDIEVGKVIIQSAKQYRFLNSISLEKIITTSNAVYLLVKPGDKEKMLQAGYVFLNMLSDTVGTEVVFIEKIKNTRKFIESLIAPVEIINMTTVFIPPSGDKEIKIQLKEADRKKIKISAKELSEIMTPLYGYGAHYYFS